jgi:hypothetical protein
MLLIAVTLVAAVVVVTALVVLILFAAVMFSRVVAVVVSLVSLSVSVSGVNNAVKLMVWFCPTTMVVVPAIVAVKAITSIMMTKNLPYIGKGMQA